MFPYLRRLQFEESSREFAALITLGKSMIETPAEAADPGRDNDLIPAGFTYLGQFVDHDITLDTTPLSEQAVDPEAVHNFRTPKLDLDCVYGGGPAAMPFLYQRANPNLLLIGSNTRTDDQAGIPVTPVGAPKRPNDLPRNDEGFALIGDPRNDENLIVAQTHLALMKFHNKIVTSQNVGFADARRLTTWHYQWIVLHDFVARLVTSAVLDDVLQPHGREFYHFHQDAFMPIEFSVAAYRLGHSMVREQYDHNRVFGPGPGRLFTADLPTLFRFTGLSGTGGDVPVPDNWIIDWRRFHAGLPALPTGAAFNQSRRLDPKITTALGSLPIPEPNPDLKNLAVRNLIRSNSLGLPSGQSVARQMGIARLTPSEIQSGSTTLDRQTPLWFYILREAEVKGGGKRLGPVGGRIVAETFVGLLQGDASSYLAQEPDWTPELPGVNAGDFTMGDLLNFVGDVNPIG
ncbi:MAG: heme peroxidase family protein [Acidobacteriota bacterium]